MDFRPTSIPGCIEVVLPVYSDPRGWFIKTYHEEVFRERGINTEWREEYFSISRKNVLRGLHFQLPPHDLFKMVFCVKGKFQDAVVDLRKGSPTFKSYQTFYLDSERGTGLIIPPGLAHAFYCLSDEGIMFYKVSKVYAPDHDVGLLWNSAGIPWPHTHPILSERDRSFPPLDDFQTPFNFEKA